MSFFVHWRRVETFFAMLFPNCNALFPKGTASSDHEDVGEIDAIDKM
jgi:hypothetical protein